MIRVLIVDDSKVIQMLLKAMIEQESDMEVCGIASNGKEAAELVKELKPSIVTMDIRMPVMDGFEATREIMSTNPVPILVVSASVNDDELQISFNAIEEGALGVIEKPPGLEGDSYETVRRSLIEHLRILSEIKLVRRRFHKKKLQPVSLAPDGIATQKHANKIVCLGASTGGPMALGEILSALPAEFPIPIVIVQHIANGFVPGLVSWLDKLSALTIKEAEEAEILCAGIAYIAPSGVDIKISTGRDTEQLKINLVDEKTGSIFKPSVNYLFKSVATSCPGQAIGGLLTGMGDDGAEGLLKMHENGCCTFIQDQESSIIFGMPRSAKVLNAYDHEVSLADIPKYIVEHLASSK